MHGDHLFVIARAHIPGTLESEQVAFFLGRDSVLTFQKTTSTFSHRFAKESRRLRGVSAIVEPTICYMP